MALKFTRLESDQKCVAVCHRMSNSRLEDCERLTTIEYNVSCLGPGSGYNRDSAKVCSERVKSSCGSDRSL